MRCDLRDSFLKAACDVPKEIGSKIWKSIHQLSRTPDASGLNLEKLSGKANWLWSIRIDQRYRTILHFDDERIMTFLFVGLHQDAYRFAETVPRTSFAPMPSSGTPPAPSADVMEQARSPAQGRRVISHSMEFVPAVPWNDVIGRPRLRSPVRLAVRSRTAKYVPLARYLLNLAPPKRSVTLSFSQIEQILGPNETLPNSARRHRPWWANDTTGHVQASAWLSAGWRVAKVSFYNKSVTFEEFEADNGAA
jgi:Txe/YoeB family toxin of Txe-Axe toxin-antitoxin module